MQESHTPAINVHVKAQYLAEHSQPAEDKFVFAYTITLTNEGAETAQLIGRYWHIVDANDQVQEVQGIGVVGEQPHIAPGESYTYTSGAVLETPTGTMRGHYEMQSASGASFNADIPIFALVQPASLH